MVAAAVGLASGAGLLWWMIGGGEPDDPPVREVRLPCNLATAAQLDEVLPGALVVGTSRYGDPGSAPWLLARCGLARERTAFYELELELRRYARQTTTGRHAVSRTAPEKALAAYESAVDDTDCPPEPVPDIGDRATGCAGERAGEPFYRVTAVRGDVLLTATLRTGDADRGPIHRLAATLLEAAR
ncbi:hypothetical protein EDD29_3853 [Actinocorallia herbida]|uniref:PknH-like protein n=1 Tax=Actinocorallia herbida TaxID=58109 RepID=A0A3N1CYC9_9ACTN|nr:hypothetical protein EDD29_3853 [Actinocorallia herbida]